MESAGKEEKAGPLGEGGWGKAGCSELCEISVARGAPRGWRPAGGGGGLGSGGASGRRGRDAPPGAPGLVCGSGAGRCLPGRPAAAPATAQCSVLGTTRHHSGGAFNPSRKAHSGTGALRHPGRGPQFGRSGQEEGPVTKDIIH